MRSILQKWRDHYLVSKWLILLSRPLYILASFLSNQIPKKVRVNGASIPLPNGKTLRLAKDCGVGIASVLYWKGLEGYEAAASQTLRFFSQRATTFVDVGANYGLYSLVAALLNPQIRVLSFEPEPRIYQSLLANVSLNGLQSQISAQPFALSDKSGKMKFFLPPSPNVDVESTGTLVEESWQNRKPHTTLEVEAVTFDEFERQHPVHLDLVKIDVEDAEAKVLAGMAETILRDRPLIVCEILPREHKNRRTLQIIRELGYTPYWITPAGYIRVSDFDFEREFEDFLLVPRNGPAIVTNPAVFFP